MTTRVSGSGGTDPVGGVVPRPRPAVRPVRRDGSSRQILLALLIGALVGATISFSRSFRNMRSDNEDSAEFFAIQVAEPVPGIMNRLGQGIRSPPIPKQAAAKWKLRKVDLKWQPVWQPKSANGKESVCEQPSTILDQGFPSEAAESYERASHLQTTLHGAIPIFTRQSAQVASTSSQPCTNNPILQALCTARGTTPILCLKSLSMIPRRVDEADTKAVRLSECPAPVGSTLGSLASLFTAKQIRSNDAVWVIVPADTPQNKPTLSEQSFSDAGFKPKRLHLGYGPQIYQNCLGGTADFAQSAAAHHALRELLSHAVREGLGRVIIAHHNVVLHENFAQTFDSALNSKRCGAYMFNDDTGGVLLLGASTDNESPSPHHASKHMCGNIRPSTRGAFAAIYHRNIFVPALAWLDNNDFIQIDELWVYLSLRGFIVRVLDPAVAVTDLSNWRDDDVAMVSTATSSSARHQRGIHDQLNSAFVMWQACHNRWELQSFPYYHTILAARHLDGFTIHSHCGNKFDAAVDKHEHQVALQQQTHIDKLKQTKQAFVLFRGVKTVKELSDLADELVKNWFARLDGRTRGVIARPLVVIQTTSDSASMAPDQLFDDVIAGIYTQSIPSADTAAIYSSLHPNYKTRKLEDSQISTAVQKLQEKAFASVLVLNAADVDRLKDTLYVHTEVCNMFFDWRYDTVGIPSSKSTIELIERTISEGRLWYTISNEVTEANSGFLSRLGGSSGGELVAIKQPILAMRKAWGQRLRRKVEARALVFNSASADVDRFSTEQVLKDLSKNAKDSGVEERKAFEDLLAKLMMMDETEIENKIGGDGSAGGDGDLGDKLSEKYVTDMESHFRTYVLRVDELSELANHVRPL